MSTLVYIHLLGDHVEVGVLTKPSNDLVILIQQTETPFFYKLWKENGTFEFPGSYWARGI